MQRQRTVWMKGWLMVAPIGVLVPTAALAHFWLFPGSHTHYVIGVSEPEETEVYQGTAISGCGPMTLSYSQTVGLSNGYDVSIEFDPMVISSSVGFEVTYSWNQTIGVSTEVTAGHCSKIERFDVYNYYDLEILTDWCCFFPPEPGTGEAQQFLHPHFEIEPY